MRLSLTVNGKEVSGDVESRSLLVDFLRNDLGMTGTHVGCDTSQCGACVVHMNGRSIKSCTLLAVQAEGTEVETIEGLAIGDKLHPMQAAIREGQEAGLKNAELDSAAAVLKEEEEREGEEQGRGKRRRREQRRREEGKRAR